jgi:pimeloyl-ACP methyl ester carboxylesterase
MGLAERPARFDYSWSGLSAWTVRAIDALGLKRVHLVVHDIGGPIGFDVVRRMPDRIASLTVLNTMVRPAAFRRPWMMEPFAWPGIGELYLRALHPRGMELLFRQVGVAGPVPSAALRAYAYLLKYGDGGAAFLKIMRGFELTPAFEERITVALQQRAFPAQVLWGQDDPALRIARHGYEARAVLGVQRVQALPGKHFVQEDSPAEIAAAVAALIRQHA